MGKGKNRQVHLTEETALLLKEYLSSHSKDEPALFLNKLGECLSSAAIYKITRELGKKAGISKNLNSRCCRPTFATMLRRGANLEFIKTELVPNTRDIETDRIFARIPQKLKTRYQLH
jgi:site-specific recombinase XerD